MDRASTDSAPVGATPAATRLLPPVPHTGLWRWQRALGWLTMLVLLAGFASLADGLLAEMRRGPLRLDVLPGSLTPLSGNVPVANATVDDFLVQARTPAPNAPDSAAPAPGPADPEVTLSCEGYFAGYWFGHGMWRGLLRVGDAPQWGEHLFVVRFRGAPQSSAQVYRVYVWPDVAAMRAASFSTVTRRLGLEPFALAAALLLPGLVLLGGNWLLGRAWQRRLRACHMAEVYGVRRTATGMELTFALGKADGLRLGQLCLLRDPAMPDAPPDAVATAGGEDALPVRLPCCVPISLCREHSASVLVSPGLRLPAVLLACPLTGSAVPMRAPLADVGVPHRAQGVLRPHGSGRGGL